MELTVFYDGACPLCRREIAFYRRRKGADAVDWVDVSQTMGDMVVPGLTRDAALGRFHVRDADGLLLSGGAAFSRLWLALPSFRRLGRICQVWPMPGLLEIGYRFFLKFRPWLQARLRARS